jgi:hypothetical protein
MIIIAVLILLCYICLNQEKYDALFPFGGDHSKNNKYTKGLKGEDYGVGMFWGKPFKKDSILDNLNKIQWLSTKSLNDVRWRRSLVIAILSSIFLIVTINTKLVKNNVLILFLVLFLFNIVYFSTNWYVHHVLWRRAKFINTHIRKIKRKLSLTQHNKIYDNKLI